MSRPAKMVGSIIALIAVALAVTGVAYWTAGYEPPVPETGLYVDGVHVEDPGVMLTIGENEVSFEDYRFYYLMNAYYYEMMYGEDVWDTDYDGGHALSLKQSIEDELQTMYAWLEIAQQEGVELTEEDKAEVQATLDEQKETLGDGFADRLEEMFFTDEDMYVRITEMQKLAQKVEQQYRDTLMEEDALAYAEENLITAKHILISMDPDAVDPIGGEEPQPEQAEGVEEEAPESAVESGSEPAEAESGDSSAVEEEAPGRPEFQAQEQAQQMWENIIYSADPAATFDELMNTWSEDPGLETNPDGYTFGEGEMVEEFYEGAKALEVGEISEPIRTDYGYHIIMRVALDEAYLEENLSTLASAFIDEKVQEKLDSVLANLEVKPGTYYADVKPGAMI